jgi:hypothetical protein
VKRNLRAGLAAGALSVALVGTVPLGAPAGASSMGMSRSSGTSATADWTEFGTLPGIAGNVHVGSLFVNGSSRNRAYVYGSVADWTCREGERPPDGGHGHSDADFDFEPPWPEPEPSTCTLESFRSIYGDPSTVSFTVDKRLTEARLTGQLSVSDHGTGSAASPPVDMTWTGTGDLYSSTGSGTFSDGDSTYRYRYSFSGRSADVDGRIGAMGFTDDPDDESSGQLGSYKDATWWRVR